MPSSDLIILVCMVFFVAGAVKGVFGAGMPAISLGILALFLELPQAVSIIVLPTFLSNIQQAVRGGSFAKLLRRFWPYLFCAIIGVIPGTMLLAWLDSNLLASIFGALMMGYALISLMGPQLYFSSQTEKKIGPVFGGSTGLVAGISGVLTVPSILFLKSVGLDRNQFVQAMGISNLFVSGVLLIALQRTNQLSSDTIYVSLIAVVPAFIAMELGISLRNKMSEKDFSLYLFRFFFVLGAYLLIRNLLIWLNP